MVKQYLLLPKYLLIKYYSLKMNHRSLIYQVLQHQHAVGGGRGAEPSCAVFLQQAQCQRCIEAATGVVLHHRCAQCPLAEKLAVGRLGPSGVRQRPHQVGGRQVVPVFGRDSVADGARSLGVEHHLGITHRARGEVDQQRVIALRALNVL